MEKKIHGVYVYVLSGDVHGEVVALGRHRAELDAARGWQKGVDAGAKIRHELRARVNLGHDTVQESRRAIAGCALKDNGGPVIRPKRADNHIGFRVAGLAIYDHPVGVEFKVGDAAVNDIDPLLARLLQKIIVELNAADRISGWIVRFQKDGATVRVENIAGDFALNQMARERNPKQFSENLVNWRGQHANALIKVPLARKDFALEERNLDFAAPLAREVIERERRANSARPAANYDDACPIAERSHRIRRCFHLTRLLSANLAKGLVIARSGCVSVRRRCDEAISNSHVGDCFAQTARNDKGVREIHGRVSVSWAKRCKFITISVLAPLLWQAVRWLSA